MADFCHLNLLLYVKFISAPTPPKPKNNVNCLFCGTQVFGTLLGLPFSIHWSASSLTGGCCLVLVIPLQYHASVGVLGGLTSYKLSCFRVVNTACLLLIKLKILKVRDSCLVFSALHFGGKTVLRVLFWEGVILDSQMSLHSFSFASCVV